ncbi:MAG: hypothetical protein H7Z21_10515 [Hymenobacter sp.]|nr:hypothetical protein [Hymenobacter sp.]
MPSYTLTVLNEDEYRRLLALAREAGLHVLEPQLYTLPPARSLPDVSKLSREELWAILEKGADTSAIPNPLAWQREERGGRNLPFGQ